MAVDSSLQGKTERIYTYLKDDLALPLTTIKQTIALLADGATVPFIARYRKERTGGLDETAIRSLEQKWRYYVDLELRKDTVIKTIDSLGKLTGPLRATIDVCREKQALEDLYQPYKPKKRTKATIAREKGLGPLADLILAQGPLSEPPEAVVGRFINPDAGITSADDALAGARDIIVEAITDMAEIRRWLRAYLARDGRIVSQARKEWCGKKSKYETYYGFSEPIKESASHRLLAIRRGAAENVLSWKIAIDEDTALSFIASRIITDKTFVFYDELKAAVALAYKRLSISLETEVFASFLEAAEAEAIDVFAKNLTKLLLEAPAGNKVIMGIDPGFRTGCKCVVIDAYGTFKEFRAIYPHPPQEDEATAHRTIVELLTKYNVELIAVGNGTASRETFSFVRSVLSRDKKFAAVRLVTVSEAGASVYSASPVAIEEFPQLDVTVRGAISIGRRLQDPLAELVKIDPKSIGVGQYQHDVNQADLRKSLGSVVESCVNFVGVEVNTASKELLSSVSGIGPALAHSIVRYREKNGPFATRADLRTVPKLGEKVFEQCAGFLRIRGSSTRLDNSAIHPERYALVHAIAERMQTTVDDLIGNDTLIKRIRFEDYVSDEVGMPTLCDIAAELKKPGRDPRSEFVTIEYRQDVTEIDDLEEGMRLTGKVTNVANFGAFVDIGVHQDGLIHISKLSNSFVKNPHDVIAVGDTVRVKVLSVDTELKRISLERIDKK